MSEPPSHHVEGFPPIVRAGARVLVLGSIPSVASLERREYYGHARNAFWPLMGTLFGFDARAPYDERCEHLSRAGVALWDVLQACVRPGSLDSDIRPDTERPNELLELLARHPTIAAVCFNGRKAQDAWRRHVERRCEEPARLPPTTLLPSTSPAMAALDFAGKLARWRVVAESVARSS